MSKKATEDTDEINHTTSNAARPRRYNLKMKLTRDHIIAENLVEDKDSTSEPGSCMPTTVYSENLTDDLDNRKDNDSEKNSECVESLNTEEMIVDEHHVEEQSLAGDHDCLYTKEYLDMLIDNITNGNEYEINENLENFADYLDMDFEMEFAHDFDEDNEEFDADEKSAESIISNDITNETIYHGHSMPISVSMIMILLHMITYNVSSLELEHILALISAHCLEVHPGLKSLHHFKKHFASFSSPLKKHFYCAFCLTCVTSDSNECVNQYCKKNLLSAKSTSYFIELPLRDQLRTLYNGPNFIKWIKERFKRQMKIGVIGDIYDGEIYKKMSDHGGPLSSKFPYNISFVLNTDGVSVFKSSKFSLWPVYLMINELPYKQRKQQENMLLAGLWFGDNKPLISSFLKPIYHSLKQLERQGIDIIVKGETMTIKAFLLCTAADLPAKSLLMNMNQFNGSFSCGKCLHKGETFKTSQGGCVHIFPYRMGQIPEPRKSNVCIENAVQAAESKKAVNGIKGPSFLMGLEMYDYVHGASIDYMHGVLLGVTKLMIKLWISTPFCKEDFSLAVYSDVIDKRLISIKPPNFITRLPRAISTHFKYWKASELRSWLFYYALPILCDLMEGNFFLHFAALVEAVHILCGDNITLESVNKSERLLTFFVMTFAPLYGERYVTLNVHQLLHLPDCVRKLGPLWSYSCFAFENANGELNKLFHGTQNIELQVLSSVNIIQHLPSMLASLPEQFKETFTRLYPGRLTNPITNFHLQFLGKSYMKELPDDVIEQLLSKLGMVPPNMEFYNRAILRGQVYHSKDYRRVMKRNTFTVKYFCSISKLLKYGFIQYFGVHRPVLCNDLSKDMNAFAFILPVEELGSITKKLSVQNALKITVPHIHPCKITTKVSVVDINSIVGICTFVSVPNTDDVTVVYVCEPPNTFETD